MRGLKFENDFDEAQRILSHSSWVRGLKCREHISNCGFSEVALFMGAWIEIKDSFFVFAGDDVALFMGAWIEMRK